MQQQGFLAPLFNPASIAVVGASTKKKNPGNMILSNLLEAGFKGKIFPIHPEAESILGLKALRNLGAISPGEAPDLVIIAVPAAQVAQVLTEAASLRPKKVGAAMVISSGFKETGRAGAELEREITEIARKAGILLLGPNCLGFINNQAHINASFSNSPTLPGNVGFFSQSDSLSSALINWAQSGNIGLSAFIGLGNKALLDESDIMAYLSQDKNTRVIAGYLESIEHGNRFMTQAQLTTRQKPVIILRAGSTAAGARAASAHTGAVDGFDMAYEAAFKQTGVIRARYTEELFHLARAFATQPLPQGPGLAVVTNSGGPGIIAADESEKAGLTMARLSEQTIKALQETLPAFASLYNPVGVMNNADEKRITQTVDIVLQDPNTHSVLVLITPPNFTPLEKITESLVEVFKKHPDKPIFCCFMGGGNLVEAERRMFEAGYPCYRFPEPAVEVIAAMYKYGLWKKQPLPVEVGYRREINKAQKIIYAARNSGEYELGQAQAHDLFHAYEMPMLKTKLARTSDEAVQIAKQFGHGVALKIASPQIKHKSDVGGVMLGLEHPNAIRSAFMEITAKAKRLRPDAYIAGCYVQAMAPAKSHEMVVGLRRDPRFGAMIFFGFDGINQEVFKDVSCRIAPLSLGDVHAMIREIRAFPILGGLHGQRSINFVALEDILLIMSQVAQDFPEIQEAICSPVLVSDRGAVVSDVRVVLTK